MVEAGLKLIIGLWCGPPSVSILNPSASGRLPLAVAAAQVLRDVESGFFFQVGILPQWKGCLLRRGLFRAPFF